MILCFIQMEARPRKSRELKQTLTALAGDIRKMKGCISHFSSVDLESENRFSLLQTWATKNDLEAFMSSKNEGGLAGGNVPDLRGPFVPASSDPLPIRREMRMVDQALMALERVHGTASGGVPKPRRSIRRVGHKALAVW